jgi:quinol monooxygenase YgiN
MLNRSLCAVPAFLVVLGLSEVRAQEENPVIALIKSKVKDTTKPFALSVEFKVKEGKEKEFEAAFKPCLEATRKEPGCVAYYLNRDPDHLNIYVMYEQFKSLDAVREHVKAKHTADLFEKITPLFDGELKVKVLLVPE